MDFKVIFRASFLHDLQHIVEFVAVHDPAAARKLGNTIVTKAEQLSFFPERHPKLRRRRGIRRFIVQKYFKIFYSIRSGSANSGHPTLLGWAAWY